MDGLKKRLLTKCNTVCPTYNGTTPSFAYYQFVLRNELFNFLNEENNNALSDRLVEFNSDHPVLNNYDILDDEDYYFEDEEDFTKSHVFIIEEEHDNRELTIANVRKMLIEKTEKLYEKHSKDTAPDRDKRKLIDILLEYYKNAPVISRESLTEYLLDKNVSLAKVDYLIKVNFKRSPALHTMNKKSVKADNDEHEYTDFGFIYDDNKEEDRLKRNAKAAATYRKQRVFNQFIDEEELEKRRKKLGEIY